MVLAFYSKLDCQGNFDPLSGFCLVSETTTSSKIVNLNTSQLDPGLYHFRIRTSGGIIVEPVVIE